MSSDPEAAIRTRPSVSVVIPAYNEVAQIGATIRDIQRYFAGRGLTYEIIVSADGTDGTREAVAEMARTDPTLRVIGQAERRGKGRGIRDAVRHATGDLVGFVDADNKTPFEEFDKFAPLFDQGYDIVIGSRALPGASIERRQPLHRRLGSRTFAVVMHLIVGLKDIPDTQCGFKFFRRQVACDLFARQRIDSYMFDIEILSLGLAAGYRIAQVPVRWRDDGDSRLRLVVGNAGHLIDLFRIRFGNAPRDVARDTRAWPKSFPPLTPDQERIRDDFMKRWLEVLPQRYSAIERFNHQYPVRAWARHGRGRADRPIRTLEIGAGLGAHIGYEDLSHQEYHALDMRENVLSVLRTRHPAVRAALGNIEQGTPFPDGYFDRIVVVHVLEHLWNLPVALDEVARVLSRTGVLSVVAPCEGGFAYSLARRVSAQRLFEKTYRSPYRWFIEREHVNTYPEIRAELAARFRIVEEIRWPLSPLPLTLNLVVGLTAVPRGAAPSGSTGGSW